MSIWHARVLLRGDIPDRKDFHGREAAQHWAEAKLKDVDPNVKLEWRNRGDLWEVGPTPDFCAQVFPN